MRYRFTETVVEKTARILTESHKLSVKFVAGATPSISNAGIILPTIPDNAPDSYVEALQGYLDKQAAKLIYSTYNRFFAGSNAQEALHEKGYRYVFDTVESFRAEKKYLVPYPGAEYNINNAHRAFLNAVVGKWDTIENIHKVLIITGMLLRDDDSSLFKDVDKSFQYDIAQSVRDIIVAEHEAGNVSSIDDSVTLSAELTKFIDEKIQEKSGESEMSSKGDGEGESDSEAESKTAPSKTTSDPSASKEAAITSDMSSSFEEAHKSSKESSKDSTKGNVNTFDYMHPTNFDFDSYVVYTYGDDKVNKIKPTKANAAALVGWKKRTDPIVYNMKKRLVNTIQVKSARRWHGGKMEGRLDTRRAYRAVHGISDAVYKKKTDKLALDVAVGIAIDLSGSMGAGLADPAGGYVTRVDCAAMSAYVLGDVMNSINVPFYTYGFTTSFNHAPPYNPFVKYDRASALQIDEYHGFGGNWKTDCASLTQALAFRDNIDGESVLFGVRKLLQRKEKRKILFVLSDGMPVPGGSGNRHNCAKHLYKVVRDATKAGVQVIGVGIQTDHVKEYYPDSIVINSVEDLVKEPLAKLDDILRKAMIA